MREGDSCQLWQHYDKMGPRTKPRKQRDCLTAPVDSVPPATAECIVISRSHDIINGIRRKSIHCAFCGVKVLDFKLQ